MTQLRMETLIINAAELGPVNPLPDLKPPGSSPAKAEVDDSVPEETRRHLGYGSEPHMLPYPLRDGYNRVKRSRPFTVAILENRFLRATFLLDLGGRLWSLVHKPSGRELLYVNPVFQPGNLAALNAWFSGGIEWNACIPGHSPLTCAPVFAARVTGADGTPVLRLYEWERIRAAPYQLDFILPEDSPWLFVQTRLSNPHAVTLPMYWWSNIAVPEREDVRVLVPAGAAINSSNFRKLARVPIPHDQKDRDATYSTNLPHAADYFFLIPDGQQPYVTALDAEGRGLIQTSTLQQRGRKLFVWGMNTGGRRWQEFLSEPGKPYIEIQAGIARTQYESFPMEPHSRLDWLEAYGLMEAELSAVHGRDWAKARQAVETELTRYMPLARLETVMSRHLPLMDRPPDEILHRGSGWGALELRRREHSGEKPFGSPGLVFDAPGPDQQPWLELLEKGLLPESEPSALPGAWLVQKEWQVLLEQSLASPRGAHWLSWLHAGVMRYAHGNIEGAVQAWEMSLRLRPSAWALRNLAMHALHRKQTDRALELYSAAHRQLPDLLPLAIECLHALLENARAPLALDLIGRLPKKIRFHGRIRALAARARLDTGDLAGAEAILTGDIEVPDIREGANVLSDLWFSLKERQAAAREGVPITPELSARIRRDCPPPPRLDFRMMAGI